MQIDNQSRAADDALDGADPAGARGPEQPVTDVRKSGRRPWGSITREQIVSAAMRNLRREGFDRMTIRGLASDMGVAPMSLYRHIRDKDDILDEVVERLLAPVWAPATDRADWEEWVVEAADRLRRFLVGEPAALHVYLTHPVVSPAAVARMEAMLEVLGEHVGGEAAAHRAYGAIQTYTVGFAALEASRSGWTPPDGDPLALRLAALTSPAQFAEGLRYLLGGIGQAPG